MRSPAGPPRVGDRDAASGQFFLALFLEAVHFSEPLSFRRLPDQMETTLDYEHHHPLLELYARKRTPDLLKPLRKEFSILLSLDVIRNVAAAIHARPRCNLLVFGVGNDSSLWMAANRHHGRTVFLENDEKWFETVRKRQPDIDARLVQYDTRMGDWKKLLQTPDQLMMELDDDITETNWDVILVDGPMGFSRKHPGRMKSIYTARQLAGEGCDVFLDDANRRVEAACAKAFFRDVKVVEKLGMVKTTLHYRV